MKKSLLDIVLPIHDPHLSALVYYDGDISTKLTYEEICTAAQQFDRNVSCFLFEGCVVVLAIKTFYYLIPSLALGILQSKATFMYIDTDLPNNKQKQILENSKASVILSDNEDEILEWQTTAHITLLGLYKLKIFQKSQQTKPVSLSLPLEWSMAYLVYTSGSTGAPKIVRVPNSCIIPNILDLRDRFNIKKSDIIFAASPFSFDPSIVDLFLALSTGAKLIMVKPSIKAMPSKVADIIRSERVTFLQATPSFLLQFGSELSRTHLFYPSSPLRTVVLGGEAFPSLKTLRQYCSPGNSTVFYNIYGITEVSCWGTLSKVDLEGSSVELGIPLNETELLVVDEEGEEIHHGEGHLMLGGRRVCLVDDETPDLLQKPVFRSTGDLVELVNGILYYRGRTDETVKRMGKRLNLHSVESIALTSGLVQQCCALLDPNQLLVLVCSGLENTGELCKYFQTNASAVEQPDEIRVLESLPVSKHSKIDRKKCLEIIQTKLRKPTISSWETSLAKEWIDATGQLVSDDANFILSGGNSLSALRLVSRIQEQVGHPLPLLIDILLNRHWKEVIDYIRQELLMDPITPLNDEPPIQIFQRCQKMAVNIDTSESKLIFELEQLWKFNMKKCIDASPLVISSAKGGSVFIGSHSNLFSAVNIENGQEIWTTVLSERIESSACCDLTGTRIFFGCYDGNFYCLDASNGHLCWQYSTGDAIKSSPVCTGSSVVFGSHDRTLYSLSVAKGELLWRNTISLGSLFASPAWDGANRILSASLDGTCSALTVLSGHILWTIKLAMPVFSSPVWCSENQRCLLASVDGFLNCCQAETGDIIWRFKAAGPIFSTPTAVEKRVVFGSHDHFLYCLDEDSGVQFWRVALTSPVYSSPFAGSIVICCDTSGYLNVLELSSGRLLAHTRLDGEVFSSPVVANQSIVVGCRDDYLYCFKLSSQIQMK